MGQDITWGTYKGERGYWEWRGKKCVFVPSQPPAKRSADGLQIIKDIEPFQNVAIDSGVIGSRRQRKDMMRAYGLEEVGNQRPADKTPLDRYIEDRQRRPDPKIVELLKKNSGGQWL